MSVQEKIVAVVGLGYVGLPLALRFGTVIRTIGYDCSESKIKAYRDGIDPTGEMSSEQFSKATKLEICSDSEKLKEADFIVVAVPTPVTDAKLPNLEPLRKASEVVGKHLKQGAIVIFESTVYPGVTEEVCGPILEETSGLTCGKDFWLGYSPERINPGDKEHTLEKIIKVVAGQDSQSLDQVAQLYELAIPAGVHRVSSIKVAEAAKVIENTQRDLNIALMNELAIVFHKLGIDTSEVLAAAGSKWNFLPFRPGLVGGHCIGVDPYYLTYKAESVGYHPQIILAGRRINDGMGKYIAEQTVKKIISCGRVVKGARALILGLTFKENCGDLRNSKVIDVIKELIAYGVEPVVWDPVADTVDAKREYGFDLVDLETVSEVDAVVAAVAHKEVLELDLTTLSKKTRGGVPFIDVKSAFAPEKLRSAGFEVWRL